MFLLLHCDIFCEFILAEENEKEHPFRYTIAEVALRIPPVSEMRMFKEIPFAAVTP